ncbi:hypothetical protein TNCV_2723401 [Trichonephila clavipes]|nr:hypothetical protein TNCV_2723401 [Trichonephila clavipes]
MDKGVPQLLQRRRCRGASRDVDDSKSTKTYVSQDQGNTKLFQRAIRKPQGLNRSWVKTRQLSRGSQQETLLYLQLVK